MLILPKARFSISSGYLIYIVSSLFTEDPALSFERAG